MAWRSQKHQNKMDENGPTFFESFWRKCMYVPWGLSFFFSLAPWIWPKAESPFGFLTSNFLPIAPQTPNTKRALGFG
jgi:hypothetical protein